MEYLEFCEKYEDDQRFIKGHLHKMAFMGFKDFPELRKKMIKSNDIKEIKEVMKELQEKRQN